MFEEILPNLYRIEIPLPDSSLKFLNSYVVASNRRFLIIDTGLNCDECKDVMLAELKKLKVDLDKTDFFITHSHPDHIGLLGDIVTDTSTVYLSQKNAGIYRHQGSEREANFQKIYSALRANGFPVDELQRSFKTPPPRGFGLERDLDYHPLHEGNLLEIGDYRFRCIETPGHSADHMCLHEADKGILVSGDHVLSDITPGISCWFETENPLKDYLASLEKVYSLDVNLVLPGHRIIWNGQRKRVKEIQEHHRFRGDEIIRALEDGGKTAFEIASNLTWAVDCDSWGQFPASQKMFAVGETIAHIRYLEDKMLIQRESYKDKITFSLM